MSLILVAILVTSGTLIPLFGSNIAYAKNTPSSRPDIEINILMSEQEFENEEGGLDIKWDHVTGETYDELAGDLRNLPMVFDVIAVPAAQHFLEQHRSELAGRYVDTLFVRYRPYNTEIFVSIWYSLGLYQNMIASRLPEQYALKVADEVQFKISILKQFPAEDENYQEWIDFNILKYNLLPISSDRVAYLSGNLHDLYLQNKATLMKEDTSPALPYGEPVIMQTISAVMFE